MMYGSPFLPHDGGGFELREPCIFFFDRNLETSSGRVINLDSLTEARYFARMFVMVRSGESSIKSELFKKAQAITEKKTGRIP